MDAHKAIITNIFNNSTLIEVPFFQRSYVWKADLWARMIEDMEYIVKTNKPHFFGSIILKEGRRPHPGENFTDCRTIVDGQQRLTTFLLFMKVLCLKLGQSTTFDCQFRIMGQSIALRHGRNDIEAFERVMASTSADKIDNPAPQSRIIEAYNYFVDHIDENKLNIMMVMMNAQFVRIDLNADEDEQQIFNTINSLGVNLTTSELLKNYFFSRDTISEYEAKWASVFEKDDDAKSYWDTEIETGRMKRAIIDIFFDSFFRIFIQNKRYNISNDDKIMYARVDSLAQSYQHFIDHYCGGDKSVILSQMKDYAICFRTIFNPDTCGVSIPGTFGIERLNIIIFGLKTSTLIPYTLYIAKNVDSEDERNAMYGILESYIMRRMVVHSLTKNYNNLFTSLIRNEVLDAASLVAKLHSGNDATTYIPTNEELLDGFQKSKLTNLQTRGILYLIESYIRPANSATLLLGFDGYSLEHLMPKKWRNNWSACASDEIAKQRDSKLLTLGNLAIIPQALNASIRDSDWTTKKSGKGANKPGLEACAKGLVTLNAVLLEDEWTEEKIDARAKWLHEIAETLWNIQP